MITTIDAPPPSRTLFRSRREKSMVASLSEGGNEREGDRLGSPSDAPLGPDAATSKSSAAPARRAGAPRRGGRLHRPVERRDPGARRLHAAGAGGDLDRAG